MPAVSRPGPPSDRRPPQGQVLPAAFFARDPLEVAPQLLGKLLVREIGGLALWGRLVEVEAYKGPDDLAAHSSRGRTPRTEVMFGPPGRAYVYFVYGMHYCLNFVCQPEGMPEAILVRALDPGPGVSRANGPGLVCRALQIDRSLNAAALEPPRLYLLDDGLRPAPIVAGPRIGVGYAREWAARPWRFCLDSPYLSKPAPPLLRRRSP
ncbi:MAG: DNA-3-methyladenine glycosylase [Candidatus Dormibacteraceae bacterium]